MKRIFKALILVLVLTCFSCEKNDAKKAVENSATVVKIYKSTPDPFFIDEKNYTFYGIVQPVYELGFDDNNHAYLTDTRNKVQIVFLCSTTNKDYAKEDFLTHYDAAIKNKIDLDKTFISIINWCKEKSVKNETITSEHFNSELTRYYVYYNDAYCLFHM
ncbi:MAG: hypothetical protein K6F15_06100 [Treponema sp.]|nr:hypothetical protein [Treponema sp.]